MALISERILEGYNPPERLVRQSYDLKELGDIHRHLKSKQIIRLSSDEMKKLVDDQSLWFNEEDSIKVMDIEKSDRYRSDYDFSIHNDGYDISEYVGGIEKYLPNMFYLYWAIRNNLDIMINVYDGSSLNDVNNRNELLVKYIGDEQIELPMDNFDIQLSHMQYTKFYRTKYAENITVPSFIDPLTILSVNIPYEVYSAQILPVNIYTYDIDNKTYSFGSKTKEEFMELVSDIIKNGITKPLFLRMHGQTMSSADEETSLILLAAMLLKIPSIPVNLYFSMEYDSINHLFSKTYELMDKDHFYSNPMFMNKWFGPNIIVHQTNADENMMMTINNVYPLSKYPVVNHDDFITVRKFDSTVSENNNIVSNEELHAKNLKDVNDKIHNEVSEQIERLHRRSADKQKLMNDSDFESTDTTEQLSENIEN